MRKKILLSATFLPLFSAFLSNAQITYTIPKTPWADIMGKYPSKIRKDSMPTFFPLSVGNHRAVIEIPKSGEVARLLLEWRRHDKGVDKHKFIIINANTSDTVKNIYRKDVNNEFCELLFGPVNAGKYYFYYLPFELQGGWGFYGRNYLPQEKPPDEAWVKNNLINKNNKQFIEAECIEMQARTAFDSFYPMEIIATKKEKENLARNTRDKFLLFPEDRKFPIRMLDNIPQRWIITPNSNKFSGLVDKNEYYAFQVGLWAINNIEDVKIEFNDLKSTKFTLQKSAFTCFNTNGISPLGKPFTKIVNIATTKVLPLWIGIDIPQNIPADTYKGKLVVITKNAGQKEIELEIKVTNNVLADRGDSETWRHSRLRWLNSTAGIDDENVAPYQPIELLNGNKMLLTGKYLELAKDGLPASINVYGNEILSASIKYSILKNNEPLHFETKETKVLKEASGIFIKEIYQSNDFINLITHLEVESDGWLKYTFNIEAKKDIDFSDIQLDIPFRKDLSNYMMGMGLPGTETPENHDAKWKGPHDALWIGNTKGGLYCELRGASYMGPLLNLYHPEFPKSWDNDSKGGFKIRTFGEQRNAIVYSGERDLKQGEKLKFECAFIITPVKIIDTKGQFTNRYFHDGLSPDPRPEDLLAGIKIVNLHHANKYNPHLNYPFVEVDAMKDFVRRWHSNDLKVKIYYTIRELTNFVTEIWALRSLGDEVLSGGDGGGYPWLREHLVDNYTPQWYQYLDSTLVDASVLTSIGTSRWFNYYIEGLKWLVKNVDIDGLYLDDVSFDREMLKRIRKVMNETKPGCLIDLHSNTAFSIGPATQYTEFFPYIDKLWFGESFNYNAMPPANWLVEVSGIPFGLTGDMLHAGGNPWRGMVYGMTNRLPWSTEGVICSPSEIWKVWDSFGIADAQMVGYWEDKPVVTTSNKDVLATAYLKDKRMLISVASWAKEKAEVTLAIDFTRAGLNPNKVKITAPFIDKFQPEKTFGIFDKISIEPTKGWLLIVEQQ